MKTACVVNGKNVCDKDAVVQQTQTPAPTPGPTAAAPSPTAGAPKYTPACMTGSVCKKMKVAKPDHGLLNVAPGMLGGRRSLFTGLGNAVGECVVTMTTAPTAAPAAEVQLNMPCNRNSHCVKGLQCRFKNAAEQHRHPSDPLRPMSAPTTVPVSGGAAIFGRRLQRGRKFCLPSAAIGSSS